MGTAITIMLYTALLSAIIAFLVAVVIKGLCKLLEFVPDEEEAAPNAAPAGSVNPDAELALVIAIARRYAGK
jgi:Na+-transporting methylmalonyl-CoA/oxaloacetate decarboxylase gamma subunit